MDWDKHKDDARYSVGGLQGRRANMVLAMPCYSSMLRIANVELSRSLLWRDDTLEGMDYTVAFLRSQVAKKYSFSKGKGISHEVAFWSVQSWLHYCRYPGM